MTSEFGRDITEYYQGDKKPDYCVLHMSVLENLPEETQRLFVGILEEINDTFDMSDVPKYYQVTARGKNDKINKGAFIKDKYKNMCPPKFRK